MTTVLACSKQASHRIQQINKAAVNRLVTQRQLGEPRHAVSEPVEDILHTVAYMPVAERWR
jgi:hypothetical protein